MSHSIHIGPGHIPTDASCRSLAQRNGIVQDMRRMVIWYSGILETCAAFAPSIGAACLRTAGEHGALTTAAAVNLEQGQAHGPSVSRVVWASVLGTAIEWYDFLIY
ncbi:MAG: hypothetical protein E6614_26905, partial [Bradyrhizobium sp.]|nr:hypothetical protein [Bradyrhizobium sp.]